MASNQAHLILNENSNTWGSVRVTIPGTPFQVQANDGTSIACCSCLVVAGESNTGTCRVKGGSACTSTTGIIVPKPGTLGVNACYLPMPVTDVNLLYFVGTVENDTVDIIWRR